MVSDYSFDLRGRTALVTGASRGIGRAIAIALAKAGAALVVHAKSDSEALRQTAQEIGLLGTEAHTWHCDLLAPQTIERGLETLSTSVDILVLNASMEIRGNILSLGRLSIEQQSQCNFVSSVLLTQCLVPAMCERGWGRVIGIGSIQEVRANPNLAVYASLKTAQTHFLKTLSTQVADQGVTVNTVAPGAIYTDRNKQVLSDSEFRQQVEAKIPMGRIGEPRDCIGAVLFFASELSSYVTGAWLPVDGGFHAP